GLAEDRVGGGRGDGRPGAGRAHGEAGAGGGARGVVRAGGGEVNGDDAVGADVELGGRGFKGGRGNAADVRQVGRVAVADEDDPIVQERHAARRLRGADGRADGGGQRHRVAEARRGGGNLRH